MGRQLNIRSDEAYAIAHEVSNRTGRPVSEIVLKALRDYGSKIAEAGELSATQKTDIEAIRAAGRRAAARIRPGGSVEDIMNEMYDANGLPR